MFCNSFFQVCNPINNINDLGNKNGYNDFKCSQFFLILKHFSRQFVGIELRFQYFFHCPDIIYSTQLCQAYLRCLIYIDSRENNIE